MDDKTADKVKIRHPRPSNVKKKAVPAQFVAAGTAKGDAIKSVKGEVKLAAGGPAIQGRAIVFIEKPFQTDRYRWMIYFDVPAGVYNLTVAGLNAVGGAEIAGSEDHCNGFEVLPRVFGGPAIAHPPNGYDITGDEKDYFVAYGTNTDPISDARVGAQGAEYIYDNLSIPCWSAQFGPLALHGAQVFRVVDSLSVAATRNVTVT